MNTFQFPCSSCGNMIVAEYCHCGKRAECPFCSKEFVIPCRRRGLLQYLTAPENRTKLNFRLGVTAGILLVICIVMLHVPPLEKKRKTAHADAVQRIPVRKNTAVRRTPFSDRKRNAGSALGDALKTLSFDSSSQTNDFYKKLTSAGILRNEQWNEILNILADKKNVPLKVQEKILRQVPKNVLFRQGERVITFPCRVPASVLMRAVSQMKSCNQMIRFGNLTAPPLYWAVLRNHPRIVIRELLKRGADPHWRDSSGKTAKDIAKHSTVKKLLP